MPGPHESDSKGFRELAAEDALVPRELADQHRTWKAERAVLF